MGAALAVLQRFEKVRPATALSFKREDTRTRTGCARLRSRYRFSMPAGAQPLTGDQLVELRRWAGRMVANGADGDLAAFARAIPPLADAADQLRADPGASSRSESAQELVGVRVRAEVAVDNGGSEEVRAAAKAVLLLYEDIDGRRSAVARERPRPPSPFLRRRIVAAGGVAGGILLAVFFFFGRGSDGLHATGPTASLVGADDLGQLSFSVPGNTSDLSSTGWTLDGNRATHGVAVRGERIAYQPGTLADGKHEVAVTRGRERPRASRAGPSRSTRRRR